MIRLCFFEKNGRLTGFTSQGHSGYAPIGQDIVCAMVSTGVMMAECAINDVAKAGAAVKVDEKNTAVTLFLPRNLSPEQDHACQTVLRGFYQTMLEQSKAYTKYLKVTLETTGDQPERRKTQL